MPPFAAGWALFLDVDGTLLDHAEHPQAVHVEAGLLRLIEDLLEATDSALALISGRSVEDIDRLFAPLVVPLAGQHGIERRSADGTPHRHEPALEHLARAAGELVRLTSAHSALVLENKGMTLALHFRRAPGLGTLAEREMRRIAAALGDEFELQAGKFVFEIKPSGKDKGTAIAEFMAEPPFTARIPVFLGDDLTDEYGFDVVNCAGGHSIKVGPGPTRARWRLADAMAVRRWLDGYLMHCGGRHSAHLR